MEDLPWLRKIMIKYNYSRIQKIKWTSRIKKKTFGN